MKRRCVFLCLLCLCLALLPVLTAAEEEDPFESPVGAINPEPGSTHDLSQDGHNIAVSLVKAGTYYFTGSSSTTRIYIEAANVTVVLKDGVHMDLGLYANVGSRASPITVSNMGGTVTIKTDAGASVYLGGYLAPAIRKSGTRTKLVIDTVDPDDPGTLVCQGGDDSAGIGDVEYFFDTGHMTGNMVFKNGNVEAYAGKSFSTQDIKGGTAGIGGGRCCGLQDCYIISGSVKAEGSGHGAGIGGGTYGKAKNIEISGGYVEASTTYAAGAAIGGGYEGEASNITITGGHIVADGYGNGIGGGGNASGDGINIWGGVIDIHSSSGNGIGAGGNFNGNDGGLSNVRIGGGYITIDVEQYALGNGHANLSHQDECAVIISSGTIYQTSKSDAYSIGSKKTDIILTGGNLYFQAKKHRFYSTPTDGNGRDVEYTDVYLDGCADKTRIKNLYYKDGDHVAVTRYQTGDMVTIDNMLCLYLASDPNIFAVETEDGAMYLPRDVRDGAIERGGGDTLYRVPKITLDRGSTTGGIENGSCYFILHDTAPTMYTPPKAKDGLVLLDYRTAEGTVIMYADCTLVPNVNGYTDAQGRWIRDYSEGPLTLYATWYAQKIRITFDKNTPEGADTPVTGKMDPVEYERGECDYLPRCEFGLRGWRFLGWTVKPDPKGCVLYEDEHYFDDPVLHFGADVTLYAQWEQVPLTVTDPKDVTMYEGGDAMFSVIAESSSPLVIVYQWQIDRGDGWTDIPGISASNSFYTVSPVTAADNGCRFRCVVHDDIMTLTSAPAVLTVLSDERKALILFDKNTPGGAADPVSGDMDPVIGEIGVPLTLPRCGYSLSGWRFTGWTIRPDPEGCVLYADGYTFDDPVTAFGRGVTLYAQWAPLPLTVSGPENAFVYASEDASFAVAVSGAGKLSYQWQIDRGDGWTDIPGAVGPMYTAAATKPEDNGCLYRCTVSDGQATVTSATAVLTVVSDARRTVILFDKNAPEEATDPVSGEMGAVNGEGGVPLTLPRCGYSLPGWRFTGWTVKPAPEGCVLYADGHTFDDPVTAFGRGVTLYAQWTLLPLPLTVSGPEDAFVYVGERAVFAVAASGSGKLSYQWQIDRGDGWRDIRGAVRPTYTTAAAKTGNSGYRYRCTVSDGRTTVTSAAAVLIVNEVPPTGDGNRPLLWCTLLLLAGAGLMLLRRRQTTR